MVKYKIIKINLQLNQICSRKGYEVQWSEENRSNKKSKIRITALNSLSFFPSRPKKKIRENGHKKIAKKQQFFVQISLVFFSSGRIVETGCNLIFLPGEKIKGRNLDLLQNCNYLKFQHILQSQLSYRASCHFPGFATVLPKFLHAWLTQRSKYHMQCLR